MVEYIEHFIADLANRGAQIANLLDRLNVPDAGRLLPAAAQREAGDALPDDMQLEPHGWIHLSVPTTPSLRLRKSIQNLGGPPLNCRWASSHPPQSKPKPRMTEPQWPALDKITCRPLREVARSYHRR
ncbi:DUF2397 family protein [Kitasatospora sp. NPDC096128]|uniref:DUF2397 family protein n=1 Tax=Kitasatospora sp. NPDC096128 TaxID=3155547 RepID=UPI00331F8D5F